MLPDVVLGLEAVVAVGVAPLQLGVDAVGHRLKVLAKLVQRIEEAVPLDVRPCGLAVAGLQLRRGLLGGLLLLLGQLPFAGRRCHRPGLVLLHFLNDPCTGPRSGAVVHRNRAEELLLRFGLMDARQKLEVNALAIGNRWLL